MFKCCPDSCREVKNAIKSSRNTLIPEIVIAALRSKKIEIKGERENKRSGKIHMRSKMKFMQMSLSETQDISNSSDEGDKKNGRDWDKSDGKQCYSCGKSDHFTSDYPKKNDKGKVRGEANVAIGSSDDPSEVY